MNEDQKNLIFKHWHELVRNCETKKLYKKLIENKIISEKNVKEEFSSPDDLHNKRLFFFFLQDRPRSYGVLLDALRESGQGKFADLLAHKHTGSHPFRKPQEEENLEIAKSPVVKNFNYTMPLAIKVKSSDKFYDTEEHNRTSFYRTRSKNRGQVLILNNYHFFGTDHDTRTGALIDEENLKQLFTQMHFKVSVYSNKTAEEMKLHIQDFASYSEDKVSDMCFLIIMSHGNELGGDTIVLGNDSRQINTRWIEEQFNNQNCRLFRGKPKIILYQVCRGMSLDLSLSHTQTDSATPTSELPPSNFVNSIRSVEDMLIGHSTLKGYKAHRDTVQGTWYMQLICEIFMNDAHKCPIDELLVLVDEKLSRRMSENRSMQTSEISNRGFKKCYLHPGIYEENGVLQSYNV